MKHDHLRSSLGSSYLIKIDGQDALWGDDPEIHTVFRNLTGRGFAAKPDKGGTATAVGRWAAWVKKFEKFIGIELKSGMPLELIHAKNGLIERNALGGDLARQLKREVA